MKYRRIFVIILVLAAIGGASYLLGWSSVFTVKQVIVLGAPNPSEAFVIRKSIPLGDKMARLQGKVISHSLEKYTWLDHSEITRNWFKGVVMVHVWTRTPVAQFQGHLIDGSGAIFDLPSVDYKALPTIVGLNRVSAKFAAGVLMALPADVKDSVRSVDVKGSDTAVLSIFDPYTHSVLTLVWGDTSNMLLKEEVYKALIALPENSKIIKMDVSAPHAPIVK